MTNNTTALNILKWLGGNKFLSMTGVTNLIYDNDSLSMKLKKNESKSTHLTIKIQENDLYSMKFTKYTPYKFNIRTGKETQEKRITIANFKDI